MNTEYLKSNLNCIIDGPLIINASLFKDQRGFFMENWNLKEFNKLIKKEITFVQDNYSESEKGVIRGMHYQVEPYNQDKLIRCVDGKIYDVIVDIRKDSKTFGQWSGYYLDSKSCNQLWIPYGFAHGFLVVSSKASVIYKTTKYWSQSHERSIRWNDPEFNIKWPLKGQKPILSEKDSKAYKADDYYI
tara:strand:- start:10910 stop:11473 length:564 start_codon:yes stop_codon:yes gene_type:complete